jgi:hypothetical protein
MVYRVYRHFGAAVILIEEFEAKDDEQAILRAAAHIGEEPLDLVTDDRHVRWFGPQANDPERPS